MLRKRQNGVRRWRAVLREHEYPAAQRILEDAITPEIREVGIYVAHVHCSGSEPLSSVVGRVVRETIRPQEK